jgi:hypothetical protein
VLDGNAHARVAVETGESDPSPRKLYPRIKRRLAAQMDGREGRFLVSPRRLDGDKAFGDGRACLR